MSQYTHDNYIEVNIYGDAQPVNRKSFGLINMGTDELEVGFTTPRIYYSPTDVSGDADLKAAAKSEAAGFFNQNPRPPKIMISKQDFSTGPLLVGTLDAALAYSDEWFALHIQDRTQTAIEAAAGWALTNQRLFGFQTSDAAVKAGTPANVMLTIQALANGYTFGNWHGVDAEPLALGYLAAGLWPDPDQKSGGWYHKPLIGFSGNTLTPTEGQAVLDAGGNIFGPLLGVNNMNPGLLFDESPIESLIIREWFKARLREDIAQLQLDYSKRGERIPFDNRGLALIGGRCYAVGTRGERIGHFRPGSVRVTVPDIADVAPADVVERHATLTVEAVESRGIQKITLNVGVLANEPAS